MKSTNHIENLILNYSKGFDKKLINLIPKKKISSAILYKAMKYVIEVGGKGLDQFCYQKFSHLLGVKKENSFRAAASVELIHCYSLVHDDSAMDNDDLRRGHETCHKKYNEVTAILVGDAFQSLAFEVLASNKTHKDPKKRIFIN